MANLDKLLAGVVDTELRAQLEAEVSALKNRTNFGIVYERHLPETVIVGDVDGLRVGDHVRPRDRVDHDDDYRVVALDGEQATILCLKTGKESVLTISDLLVVRRFGDPADVALAPVGSITRSEERPYHVVIDGENFHALQLLTFVYGGQVDCIYIDPPYNTGAHDWTYNNRFVDAKDTYRHSKWLSFMEKRLRLARRLLRPDGVLVVTIDEHEVHHLGLLLEDLFPDAYRQMISIVTNPKGVTQERFSRVEEYALACFLGNAAVTSIGDDLLTPLAIEEDDASESRKPRWKGLLRSGTNARREDRRRMFYPVLLDAERGAVLDVGEPLLPIDKQPDFETSIRGLTPAWPVRKDGSLGNWGVGAETLKTLIQKGYVSLGNYDPKRGTWGISYLARTAQEQIASGVLEILTFDKRRNVVDVRYTAPKARRIKTIWHRTTHDAGAYGTDLLRAFLTEGRKFPFPKSLYVVRDTLAAIVGKKRDALVVDFFAGSGTTLHATCLLNREDGGHRRCILVTNNEVDPQTRQHVHRQGYYRGSPEYEKHGIFDAVTKPRCEAAITGVRSDGQPITGSYLDGRSYADGFEENVEFFRLDYLDAEQVELGRTFDAIHPLVWLAAGGLGKRPKVRSKQSYMIVPTSRYAVLFRDDAFRDFEDALAEHETITHVFLVTDSEEAYADMRERVGVGRQTVMLYRDFLRHYRRQGRP